MCPSDVTQCFYGLISHGALNFSPFSQPKKHNLYYTYTIIKHIFHTSTHFNNTCVTLGKKTLTIFPQIFNYNTKQTRRYETFEWKYFV